MTLGACGKLSKWILLILNTVLLLEGISMLSLGLWLRFSDSTRAFYDTTTFNTCAFVTGVTVLITLGSALLGVAAFGGFSACKENRIDLRLFAALLALLAGSVAVLGAVTYSRRDKVWPWLSEFYDVMYALYVAFPPRKDRAMGVTLLLFHKELHCCGIQGSMLELEEFQQTCPIGAAGPIVPACPAVIASAIQSKAPVVMDHFLGTGAVLLGALVCTVILMRNIKRGTLRVGI